MQDDVSKFQDKHNRVPDLNEIEELLHLPQGDAPLEQPLVSRDVNPTNLALPDGQDATAARQILDMKYIYLKVRDL